jgi:tetratricopeptide (TPR) repeat protein
VLYAQQKQYDKARTALEMAIRTHPSYAIAYENLGDVYAKLASQAYDKALQLDNSNSTTQNKLALIRDLITTSGKGNVKPTAAPAAAAAPAAPVVAAPAPAAPAPVAPAPVAAKPAAPAAASATVVTATPGAAAAANAKPASVATAPAPAPEKAASSASDDVAKAVVAWADAWSRKDMKGYLGAYASDFDTPKGMSRKAWEQERQQRIAGKGGKISVSVDAPQVTINGDKATAKFRQHYKATGLSSSTSKTLVLVRSGSKWLIKEENAR